MDQERGEGRIKFLFTLFLLAVIAYVGAQFVPAYWRSVQMQDATQSIVTQAVVQNLRDNDVRARLEEKAMEYHLPDNKRIELMHNGKRMIVQVSYTHDISLPFYIYQKVNYAFDIGGSAAAGVVTVVLTIIVASFALRLFARVFQFEEAR